MKKNYFLFKCSFAALVFLFIGLQGKAQLKIGDNPTQIRPFSILELESDNQALRLTQGDTAEVNDIIQFAINGSTTASSAVNDLNEEAVQAAEGLIMFQNALGKDRGLYIRSAGTWHKVMGGEGAIGTDFWRIGGNALGTDSAFLGGVDEGMTLSIGTDNTGYVLIRPDGMLHVLSTQSIFEGEVVIDSTLVVDSLNVGGSALALNGDSVFVSKPMKIRDHLVIESLEDALGSDSMLLVLGADGTVRKMELNSFSNGGANISFNGEQNTAFEIVLGSDQTHGAPYLDTVTAGNMGDPTRFVLHIPAANLQVSGLVTDSAQAFSGAKTFADSIAVGSGTDDSPRATLDVRGNVNVAAIEINSDLDLSGDNGLYSTINVNAENNSITVALPDAGETNVEGRIYTIRKVSGDLNHVVTIDATNKGGFEDENNEMPIYNKHTSRTVQATNGMWRILTQ